MQLLNSIKNLVTGFLQAVDQAWWAEIKTTEPRCTYYFGPFDTAEEARTAQAGYIEDLENERAKGIEVTIKRCNPKQLTVWDEEEFA